MKKLLLILLIPMIGFGQNDADVKLQADVVKLRADVENINYRMSKHHKQFYNGVILRFIGGGNTNFLNYQMPN